MRKVMMLAAIVVVWIFVMPVQVFAGERIEKFTTSSTINKDGSVDIVENIRYDFGDAQRHGIVRVIPFVKKNSEGKEFELMFSQERISIDHVLTPHYQKSTSNGAITFKIGDPAKTITGIHEYQIAYTVSGALTYFSDHDELYWNITGNEWQVPIDQVEAIVSLPQDVEPQDTRVGCFTGPVGSTTSDCTHLFDIENSVFKTTRPLQNNEGLTVVFGFPKKIVAVLEPKPVVKFFDTIRGKVVFVLIMLTALFWYIILPVWIPIKWYMNGRDPKKGRTVLRAWYDPPHTKDGRALTPAETGTLIDENAGNEEIAALIVWLAKQGYLRIREGTNGTFKLIKEAKTPPPSYTLLPFESHFYHAIFRNGDTISLDTATFFQATETLQKALYERLVSDGFFPTNPDSVRKRYRILGGFAGITFNFFLLITALVFGRIMPRKTEYGAQMSDVAKGLQSFLTSQERQLAFQAKEQMMFEKLLPYAVAFGVEKIWIARFKDINLQSPKWYQGSSMNSFQTFAFAHAVSSSLRSYTSSTKSSSGFSSGFSGGSSGGGGGGGGGGSW